MQLSPTSRRRAQRPFGGRLLSGFGVVALIVAACGGTGSTTTPSTAAGTGTAATAVAPATSAAATVAATASTATTSGASTAPSESAGGSTAPSASTGASTEPSASTGASTAPGGSPGESPNVAPYNGATPGSGTGKKIGYISLGDSVPFVKLVSDGIREQAKIAGADFVFCDSEIKEDKSLDCARILANQKVQGVLNFQVYQQISPEICAALPQGAPVIAIDITQKPCETSFMGADNRRAGRIAGEAIGKFAKDTWNCDYTAYVSLESTAAGQANTDRMGGFRDGFTEFCPIKNEKILDGADRTDPALEKVSNLLPALPGNKVVVVAINEDGILGAIGAAKTQGREKDLFYAGQGTDPSIWCDIKNNPQYIASTAYFPEKYGTILIPAIIDAMNGKEIPKQLFTPHVVINAQNIDQYYKVEGCS